MAKIIVAVYNGNQINWNQNGTLKCIVSSTRTLYSNDEPKSSCLEELRKQSLYNNCLDINSTMAVWFEYSNNGNRLIILKKPNKPQQTFTDKLSMENYLDVP